MRHQPNFTRPCNPTLVDESIVNRPLQPSICGLLSLSVKAPLHKFKPLSPVRIFEIRIAKQIPQNRQSATRRRSSAPITTYADRCTAWSASLGMVLTTGIEQRCKILSIEFPHVLWVRRATIVTRSTNKRIGTLPTVRHSFPRQITKCCRRVAVLPFSNGQSLAATA